MIREPNTGASRSFDVVVASGFLGLFAPVMVAVAVALAVQSRESVFLARRRPGLHGRCFRVLGFRTMAGPVGGPDAEARQTPVG